MNATSYFRPTIAVTDQIRVREILASPLTLIVECDVCQLPHVRYHTLTGALAAADAHKASAEN